MPELLQDGLPGRTGRCGDFGAAKMGCRKASHRLASHLKPYSSQRAPREFSLPSSSPARGNYS
eukprot:3646270-Pyramimonas_sp.AAC.1